MPNLLANARAASMALDWFSVAVAGIGLNWPEALLPITQLGSPGQAKSGQWRHFSVSVCSSTRFELESAEPPERPPSRPPPRPRPRPPRPPVNIP